jgi:hypothetical protein
MRNNEKENMKTQHTFKPMEFAQWYDNRGVHHAVTVLEVDNEEFDSTLVKIHYYTGIEMSDVAVKWVPVDSLIPMIGA